MPALEHSLAEVVLPAAATAMSRHLHTTPIHVSCAVAWHLHLRETPADLFYERLSRAIEDIPISKNEHVSEVALAMFACHASGKLSHGRAEKMYNGLVDGKKLGQLSGNALACLSRLAAARGLDAPRELAPWAGIWRRHVRALVPVNVHHVVLTCGQHQVADHVLFAEAAIRMTAQTDRFSYEQRRDLLLAAAQA